jgi:ubiquinone/menaquinone biosynthesis C-methylase UbiE
MPSPELFFDTMFAPQRTAALKAAIDLEVFTAIGDGARMVADIAGRCQASVRGIRILCDNLTIMGFLTKTGDTYDLTPDSAAFLSTRSPEYVGSAVEFLYSLETIESLDRLTETVRSGTVVPAANTVSDDNPIWVKFARGMAPLMAPLANAMADVLQVDAVGPIRVLDIAAGHGMCGIAMASRNPAAEIVAVDWAPVLAVATENAQALGVGDRHRALNGDAFKVEYGSGFDIALLANFLHHFDQPTCVRLLRKTAAALKPGGRVAILEFVPNDDRITPPLAAAFSLTMLSGTPSGDAYTFREHRAMLIEAGFKDVSTYPLPALQTIIVASR